MHMNEHLHTASGLREGWNGKLSRPADAVWGAPGVAETSRSFRPASYHVDEPLVTQSGVLPSPSPGGLPAHLPHRTSQQTGPTVQTHDASLRIYEYRPLYSTSNRTTMDREAIELDIVSFQSKIHLGTV